MNKTYVTPVHPGEVLLDELEELNLSVEQLAAHIGETVDTINKICQSQLRFNAELAMKLSKALGGSPQFWLNLQNNWELSQVKESSYKNIKPVAA